MAAFLQQKCDETLQTVFCYKGEKQHIPGVLSPTVNHSTTLQWFCSPYFSFLEQNTDQEFNFQHFTSTEYSVS